MKKYSNIFLITVLSLIILSACADRESLQLQTTEVPESQTIVSSESQETEGRDIQMTESLPSIGRALSWNGVAWRSLDAPVHLAKINNMDWTMPGYDDGDWAMGAADKAYTAALRNRSLSLGVGVVFSGHDHVYTRSFPMDGLKPLNDGDDGIVYFCLGSPTGTKYYDLYEEEMDYAAVADGSRGPSVTRVDVTKNTMTVTTFIRKTDGSLTVLDSYEITK